MNVIPTSCWICLQLDLHLLAELEVERAERLVEQQHARPVHERPRERDALALAARELAGLAPVVARRGGPSRSASPTRRSRSRLGHLAHEQAVGDVLADASCAGTARSPGRPCSRRARTAPGVVTSRPWSTIRPAVGSSKPGDHPQRRRLARARRPEHREELAVGDLEVDAGDGDDVAVALVEALEADGGRRSSRRPSTGAVATRRPARRPRRGRATPRRVSRSAAAW